MTQVLLMPKLGLTMSEGQLLEWKVEPGQRVRKGEVLYVVETEKVATEIEADTDGIFAERLVQEGENVAVGTAVGRMADSGNAAPVSPAASAEAAADRSGFKPAVVQRKSDSAAGKTRIIATPLARRIARQHGVDLRTVTGSGPRGRIKANDIELAAAQAAPVPAQGSDSPPGAKTRQRPSPVQASMARRLAAVKHGVPHFYLSTEVEVSALIALRLELNADTEMTRLTLTHFILAAVGRTLSDLPEINRVWADDDLIAYSASDVGMAVETDSGLFVPIVRNAGISSLDLIADSVRDLTDKAKSGRLHSNDMAGAAISVSNAGMHDVTWLTPIINPGQSAILGVGSVREVFRPNEAGAPALRREMGIVFSGDHRVHTGLEGLAFLNRLKTYLETPMRLLRHR